LLSDSAIGERPEPGKKNEKEMKKRRRRKKNIMTRSNSYISLRSELN